MTALSTGPALTMTQGRRIANVIRLHFANPMTVLVVPGIVIAAIFVVNFAIWWIVGTSAGPADAADAREGFQWSGASYWIFFYMMVVAIQAMNASFALSQGLSSTRRDFFLGSLASFGLLAVLWTAILTVLGLIEQATDGWGFGGRLFSSVLLGGDPAQRAVVILCLFLFFFTIGTAFGATFVRWKALGVTALSILLSAILLGAAVLITLTASWPAVGEWFGRNGAFGTALWLLAPGAVFGLLGWLLLRRATVR
jgi:hypothetical protein